MHLATQFEPVSAAAEGARAFTGGRHTTAGLDAVQASPTRGTRIAGQYAEAMNRPETGEIRHSYHSFRRATNRQYEFMTRAKSEGGMGMQHEVVAHDPYKTAHEMAADVAKGRIKTFATSSTGSHAFMRDEENDRFRAVHDVFGHAAIGRDFSRHGEEAAFRSHRQMYPRSAHVALTSETRGQNSFLNYGPTGDFPEQGNKLVALPGRKSPGPRFINEYLRRKAQAADVG